MSKRLLKLLNQIPVSKNRLALAAAVLLGLFYFIVSTYTTSLITESAEEEKHSLQIQRELLGLLTSLIDRETGERGYTLTGNLDYLEPYNRSQNKIKLATHRIKALTSGDASQQKAIAEVERLVNENGIFLRKVVTARQSSGLPAAIALINSNKGKATLDQIRLLIEQMIETENENLRLKSNEYKRNYVYKNLSVFFLVCCAGYLAYRLVRSAVRTEYLQEDTLDLERQNTRLRVIVTLLQSQIKSMEEIVTEPVTDYGPLKLLIKRIIDGVDDEQ